MFLNWRRCLYGIGSILSYLWWTWFTKKYKILE